MDIVKEILRFKNFLIVFCLRISWVQEQQNLVINVITTRTLLYRLINFFSNFSSHLHNTVIITISCEHIMFKQKMTVSMFLKVIPNMNMWMCFKDLFGLVNLIIQKKQSIILKMELREVFKSHLRFFGERTFSYQIREALKSEKQRIQLM